MPSVLPRGALLAGVVAVIILTCGAFAQPIAIQAGRIETAAGEPIENGVIVIEGGRITAIGADVEVPAGAEVIDASGGVVVPGFVHPASNLGLSASGGAAHYRVADELYAHQDAYKRAAKAGFTTLCLRNSANGIGGQAALVRSVAGSADDMLLSDRGPLSITYRADTDTKNAIKTALDKGKDGSAADEKVAPLVHGVKGDVPVLAYCGSPGDVLHLLKLVEPYKSMNLLLHSNSAQVHRVAEELGEKEASVVVPATIHFERYTRNRINVPRLLAEAGAKLACIPANVNSDTLDAFRVSMAELVRAGLDRETAIKSITSNPAEMLGLDYRLGTLAVGKDANLVILDGDIFDARANIQRVLLEGETVYDATLGGIR